MKCAFRACSWTTSVRWCHINYSDHWKCCTSFSGLTSAWIRIVRRSCLWLWLRICPFLRSFCDWNRVTVALHVYNGSSATRKHVLCSLSQREYIHKVRKPLFLMNIFDENIVYFFLKFCLFFAKIFTSSKYVPGTFDEKIISSKCVPGTFTVGYTNNARKSSRENVGYTNNPRSCGNYPPGNFFLAIFQK